MTLTDDADDLLWQQLQDLPAFRALLRAVESRFYHQLPLTAPVLDLGCGDGHFAGVTFSEPIAAGIDPWWGPLQKSRRLGIYDVLTQGMGDRMPFADAQFATIFSNSVLEHIPDLQPVLNEANRVLQPGGLFIITTPSHYFTEFLGGGAALDRLGLNGASAAYRRFFNRISRHAHTDSPERWAERLARAGFTIERWQYYFSRDALRALEVGHAQGVPAAVIHALTGWWVVAPWRSSLKYTERWLRPFYEEEAPETGAYLLLVVRKSGPPPDPQSPLTVTLPEPRPFPLAQLAARERHAAAQPALTTDPGAAAPGRQFEVSALPTTEPEQAAAPRPAARLRFDGPLLVGLALGAAVLGQLAVSRDGGAGGLLWFALAAAVMYLGGQRLALVNPGLPGWQRWLLAPAWLFSAAGGRLDTPALALLSWLFGSALAIFALWPAAAPADDQSLHEARAPGRLGARLSARQFDWLLTGGLFFLALLPRLWNLGGQPWMLNGSEANIGLDALAVANGRILTPFGSGWLSNPLLPAFLLALPLRLFGPSTVALRLLSPFFGAATVAALYLIGRRLWNREVGLVAALLLLGSHFHLHYSRLGLTNVWDGLLLLLALGGLALAWRERRPALWLGAGAALGLNAFVYTGSHLLPLILATLIVLQLLIQPAALRQRFRGLATAVVVALVVAWPQLAFYAGNPNIFLERASSLGLLQTGWLANESLSSGQSMAALLLAQLQTALLAFFSATDVSSLYAPGAPLLGFWPAALLGIGLFYALLQLRSGRQRLLLAWVGITVVFAGALLLGNPASHRLVAVTPALMLLAAQPFVWFGGRLLALVPRLKQQRLALFAAAAIFLALLDGVFYFVGYRDQPGFGDRNTEIGYEIGSLLADLDQSWTVYLYGPPVIYADFPTIPFLAPGFQRGVNLHDVVDTQDTVPPPQTPNVLFVIIPERSGQLGQVSARYPQGTEGSVDGVYGVPLFFTYRATVP